MLVEFSKDGPSLQLNGRPVSNVVHGMLEGEDYGCIDMVFPLSFAYVVKATRYIEDCKVPKGRPMYSELLLDLFSRSSKMNSYYKA